MARITVEDCLDRVDNRFDLVLKASARARKLISGSQESRLSWDNDKASVVALREIAAGYTFNEEGEVHDTENDQDADNQLM